MTPGSQTPGGPPPLPRPSLAGALSGPLVLTTLGILLAADHLGHTSFGRSWPILLIVFGLCKLVEFGGARRV